MGEYWKPVNLDKRQQVHPHRVGDGLKLCEWNHEGSHTLRAVDGLIEGGVWSPGDEVRVVSDYGGTMHLRGPVSERAADYDDEWGDAHELAPDHVRKSYGRPW